MSDRPWKKFERDIARILGGRRFFANSGAALDVESAGVVAQCKHVRVMSLEALSKLAEQAQREGQGKNKAGVVAIQVRRGRGKGSPILFVMTADVWELMNGTAASDAAP